MRIQSRRFVAWMVLASVVLAGSPAWAGDEDAEAETIEEETDGGDAQEEYGGRAHVNSALRWRIVPSGLSVKTDLGYQHDLFKGDGLLVDGTLLEAGVTTNFSPANAWAGFYLEAIPVAFLQLRGSIQSLTFFGTFGSLYDPDIEGELDWTFDDVPDDLADGTPADGWMAEAVVTPRLKVGSFVFLAETMFRYVDMGTENTYWESNFDLILEPEDTYWQTSPTVGWVWQFDKADMWLLTGLQWEHTQTDGTDVTTDMGRLLGLVGLPWTFPGGGDIEAALLAGYWLRHPNDDRSFYIAGQFSVDWAL